MSCPKCWDPEVCWECSPKTASLRAEAEDARRRLKEAETLIANMHDVTANAVRRSTEGRDRELRLLDALEKADQLRGALSPLMPVEGEAAGLFEELYETIQKELPPPFGIHRKGSPA